mgnify:CR=1 FL=1
MKNFRVGENRGITLVVLVITIVVMLIITTTIISLSTNNLKTKHLSNMYTDIKSLDDKVAVFYNQYGTLPLKEKFTGSMQFQTAANPNDDLDGYYVIDVNKLNNLVLTKKLTWQNEDVYIINTKTHTIYYPHGVTLDGETYYRLPGEYSVIKEKIDAGTVASDASYIGKYVNYTVPNGGDPNVKWRIFYADSSNIYLIASDYLKYDYVPTKTTNGKEYTMYKISTDYRLSFNNMYEAYTGSVDITDKRIKKWMKWVGKYPNSTNYNIRSVAYMLDSNIWNVKYQNSYAEYVIGGPTIEMFCASYKATHTEKYIEEEVTDANGYKVKWNTDSSYSDYIDGLSTSELENLYVINDTTKAYAYWLASPSARTGNYLLSVYYVGLVIMDYHTRDNPGLRALVCLKSNVQLVPTENENTYDLNLKN